MALSLVIISTLLLILLVLNAETSNSLQNTQFMFRCFSDCSRYGCRKAKDIRDSCPGGTVYGVCGCCLQCAKLEGEECGGYKNMKGTCDEGLFCHIKKKRIAKYAVGKCRSEFSFSLFTSIISYSNSKRLIVNQNYNHF